MIPRSAAAFLPNAAYAGKTISVGEKALVLPEAPGEADSFIYEGPADGLRIPIFGGELVIEGRMPVRVQDNRPYGENAYCIRLSLTPGEGKIEKASLRVRLVRVEN